MNRRSSKFTLLAGCLVAGVLIVLAAALLSAGRPALAEDGAAPAAPAAPGTPGGMAPAVNTGGEWEVTPQSLKSIERGLSWLSNRQNKEDGSFGSQGGYSKHAGITGLCGLAFMSDGNLPGRGKYGSIVERSMDYVMACSSDSNGLITSADATSGPMYGHGFATLFLSEVYGMTGNEQVREKLRLAIRLIVSTQSRQGATKGGWRYMPIPQDADMSVTICQTMALRAARNAGIKVPKQTMDMAIEYVRRSHSADGGFSYTAGGGGATFPCTAAAVASLYYSGVYGGKEVNDGIAYMLRQKGQLSGNNPNPGFGHFFYGHYYAVQAFFLAGGKAWHEWFPAIRDYLIRIQQPDGSWTEGVGPEFATAMALIILQVPNRYLPILER